MDNKIFFADIGSPEYDRSFRDLVRGVKPAEDKLASGFYADTGAYTLPSGMNGKYEKSVAEESIMRQIATVLIQYKTHTHIMAAESDDIAEFVPENGSIDIQDVGDDFTMVPVGRYKLAALLRLSDSFASDAAFDIEGYLIRRLAKAYGRAEDKAFISGTGTDEPAGLLHDTYGAETGTTASALTYDDIIALYYSVKSEYRRNGVWLMNDETALTLKQLKDNAGSYLWRDGDDTLLGKPIRISEYMPSAESGSKPVLFGDFSYYWVVKRSPVTVKTLKELFSLKGQVGYLSAEFIDGRLVRSEAVKALKIASE